MNSPQLAALVAVGILVPIALLQAALATGLPLGRMAWGGKYRVLPRSLRFGSAASVGVLGIAAGLVLAKSGLLATSLNAVLLTTGAWVGCAFFLFNTAGNLLSQSKWERAVMTPAAFILAMCFAVVAYS